MSATPPNLGVAAPSSTPPVAAPVWPDAAQLPTIAPPLPLSVASTWPRPALWATVLLLFLALALIGWNVYGSSRRATRPTTLERGALQTSRLELNRADRVQLLQLPGVGETLAARMEAYRDEHNGFRDLDELRQVHGIGPILIEKLRPLVYVEPFDAAEEAEPRRPASPANRPAKTAIPDKPASTKKTPELNRSLDLNRATAEELQRLPGIGPALSARIIEARQKAPFKKVDELRGRVPGIGVKKLEQLRPFVTVAEAENEKKD
jgi:competence protein ComEA